MGIVGSGVFVALPILGKSNTHLLNCDASFDACGPLNTGHLIQTGSQDVLIWVANVIKAGVLTRGDNRAVAYPDTLSRSYWCVG